MLKTISILLQSFLISMTFACSNAAEFAGQSGIKSQNSSTPETDSPITEEPPTPEELCTGADDFDSCITACEEGSEECPLPPQEPSEDPVDEPDVEPGKGEDPTTDETCTDAEGNTEVNCINVTTTTEEPPTPTDENPAPVETTPGETDADTSCQDEEYANPEECPVTVPTENPSQNAAQNN